MLQHAPYEARFIQRENDFTCFSIRMPNQIKNKNFLTWQPNCNKNPNVCNLLICYDYKWQMIEFWFRDKQLMWTIIILGLTVRTRRHISGLSTSIKTCHSARGTKHYMSFIAFISPPPLSSLQLMLHPAHMMNRSGYRLCHHGSNSNQEGSLLEKNIYCNFLYENESIITMVL